MLSTPKSGEGALLDLVRGREGGIELRESEREIEGEIEREREREIKCII